jgi:hypothetical protein
VLELPCHRRVPGQAAGVLAAGDRQRGLLLLTGKVDGFAREFFFPVGIFGLVVTLGLFSYAIYGIAKCHALINVGKAMEASLRLAAGQFKNRPREVLRHVNEPFAAAIIYLAAMAAWTYLAAFDAPRWIGAALAVAVFIMGFAIIFEYNRRPRKDAADAHGDAAARGAHGVGLHSCRDFPEARLPPKGPGWNVILGKDTS